MKLLTPELQQRFDEVGDQSDNPNPLAIARFIDRGSPQILYATEYDPYDGIIYGYLHGSGNDGWGGYSEFDMEPLDFPRCEGIERDPCFKEAPIGTFLPELLPQIRATLLRRVREHPRKGQEPER